MEWVKGPTITITDMISAGARRYTDVEGNVLTAAQWWARVGPVFGYVSDVVNKRRAFTGVG